MIGIGGGSAGHSGALSDSSFQSPLVPPSPLAGLPPSVAPSNASIRLSISFWLGVPLADEADVGRVPASVAAELLAVLVLELVLGRVLLGTELDAEPASLTSGAELTVPPLLAELGGGPAFTIVTPASRLGSGSSPSGPSAQAESSTSHESARAAWRKPGERGRNARRWFVRTLASCHDRRPCHIDRS
jgi:hypothetical protein